MTIRKKLQAWLCNRGALPAVTRISLASVPVAFYSLIWFFVLMGAYIGLRSFSPLPIRELTEELFTLVILVVGLLALPMLHVVYMMVRRLEQRPLSSIGLRLGRHTSKEFLSGLVLGIILPTSGFLYLYWSSTLQVTWKPAELTLELGSWLSLLVLGWFGVAFWEELFFRGYMLQTLASGIGMVPAVLITSLSFGAFHVATYGMNPLVLLSLVFFGIVLAILYLRTKSLWAPVGMHFANNFWIAHMLPVPLEQDMRLPFITVNGQPVQLEPLHLFFQTKLVGGKSIVDLYSWESLPSSLLFYGLLVLLIWKLPLFRPHPEMEALWQQYVPIAQPWAQLRAWWARRKGHAATTADPPPKS